MKGIELALKYSPYILFDKAEPFNVKGMGYRIFRQSGKSSSFERSIDIDKSQVSFVIEYSVYFDYDIQHLYDLEHVWVYVGPDGKVCDAEASFHGYYLKSILSKKNIVYDGTRVKLYCQPGKHAFMPEGKLFRIMPDWDLSCNKLSGIDGLLVMSMFENQLSTTPELQEKVHNYIKKHFSFKPTLQFQYRKLDDSVFMSWDELKALIPIRIKSELEIIRKDS